MPLLTISLYHNPCNSQSPSTSINPLHSLNLNQPGLTQLPTQSPDLLFLAQLQASFNLWSWPNWTHQTLQINSPFTQAQKLGQPQLLPCSPGRTVFAYRTTPPASPHRATRSPLPITSLISLPHTGHLAIAPYCHLSASFSWFFSLCFSKVNS